MPVLNRQGARVYLFIILGGVVIGVLFQIISLILTPHFEVYQLVLDGEEKTYEIKYNIEGSKVQSITAYPESFSMVVLIEEAREQGSLKVQFNRNDMVELLGNEGQEVSAFVDERGVSIIGISPTRDTVTAEFDFPRGSEVIELIGAKYD